MSGDPNRTVPLGWLVCSRMECWDVIPRERCLLLLVAGLIRGTPRLSNSETDKAGYLSDQVSREKAPIVVPLPQ